MTDLETKISKLEMLVAHQDKQIADLSDMTADQWKEIDILRTQVKYLVGRMKDMEASGGDDKLGDAKTVTEMAAAEKPPHY
ncbi:MAG: SlyX family protein [Pseudobdellovibrionaceae bacterium]|jgi:SlyX protein|nr:SlyX family protein [Pseudobdellovibrionaceae bacterium]